ADRLFACPAVQLFGTTVPIGDHVVHITHENRVMCEVKQLRLLLSCSLITPVRLDELDEEECDRYKGYQSYSVLYGMNEKRIDGGNEEVIDSQCRKEGRAERRNSPAIPGGADNRGKRKDKHALCRQGRKEPRKEQGKKGQANSQPITRGD